MSQAFEKFLLKPRPVSVYWALKFQVPYHAHQESRTKLASKKLRFIGRARHYFTPKHQLALYRAQVRLHMEYYSYLEAAALQFQLELLVCIQYIVL